jgi:hypothetical protein
LFVLATVSRVKSEGPAGTEGALIRVSVFISFAVLDEAVSPHEVAARLTATKVRMFLRKQEEFRMFGLLRL